MNDARFGVALDRRIRFVEETGEAAALGKVLQPLVREVAVGIKTVYFRADSFGQAEAQLHYLIPRRRQRAG